MLSAAEYAAMRALQTWWEEEGAKDHTKFSSVDTGQCTRVHTVLLYTGNTELIEVANYVQRCCRTT